MPQLSVIIPTHRRADTLKTCLEHLEAQTAVSEIEVIVVDDIADTKTKEVVNMPRSIETRLVEVSPCQQGIARNEGLRHARGTFILFIGDDIFLAPDACERHLDALKKSDGAVLGFTTWDPAVGITPVMRWLETSGWQFGYPMIAEYAQSVIPSAMQHRYTYASQISLPLTVAQKHLFRTDIHLYGWEDIEWGMRLKNAGVHLYYEPDAVALHHHRITMEESLRRMETLGQSAVEIARKVPEFYFVPRGWKLLTYKLFSLLPTMAGKHRDAFLSGIHAVPKK